MEDSVDFVMTIATEEESVIENMVKTCSHCRSDEENNETGRFLNPCKCIGTSAYIHAVCLNSWINASGKISCDICKSDYRGLKKTYSFSKALIPLLKVIIDSIRLYSYMALIILSYILSSLGWHWIANIPLLNVFSNLPVSDVYYEYATPTSFNVWKTLMGRHLVGGVLIVMAEWILVDIFSTMVDAAMQHTVLLKTIHEAHIADPSRPNAKLLNQVELEWVLHEHQKLVDLQSESWVVWILHHYQNAHSFILWGLDRNENDRREPLLLSLANSFVILKIKLLSFMMLTNIPGLVFGFLPFVIGRFTLLLTNSHLGDYCTYRFDIIMT